MFIHVLCVDLNTQGGWRLVPLGMWGLCKFSFDFEYKDYILLFLHMCDLFVSASARMIIRKKSMNCVNAICICNKGHLHFISNTRYPIIKISKNCVAEELFQLGWKIMFVYDSWEYIIYMRRYKSINLR